MAESLERYCGNCGHELRSEDQFCRNCGRPVHRNAYVPTPEADVPVPPPPQQTGGDTPPPLQHEWIANLKEIGARTARIAKRLPDNMESGAKRALLVATILVVILAAFLIGVNRDRESSSSRLSGGGDEEPFFQSQTRYNFYANEVEKNLYYRNEGERAEAALTVCRLDHADMDYGNGLQLANETDQLLYRGYSYIEAADEVGVPNYYRECDRAWFYFENIPSTASASASASASGTASPAPDARSSRSSWSSLRGL